jgi:hypothetical protein
MAQAFSFSFTESFMAAHAGVLLKSTHFDVDAILRVYEAIKPVAADLGVEAPRPRLAGFGYPHVVSLGAPVEFPDDGEPNVGPVLRSPRDIDRLREPADYLAAPLLRQRLQLATELGRRRADALSQFIGHLYEGPITTAVLLYGQDFFTLVYDDPARAHALLRFCTETALSYADALHRHFHGDTPIAPGPRGNPDDFAGMLPPALFEEFVIPYWHRLYDGQQATRRHLHSELLREAHLPFLVSAKIDSFDPSADQYVTPELLSRKCHCPFRTLVKDWEIHDLSADALAAYYREIAGYRPFVIAFSLSAREELGKIRRLLQVARELQGSGT